MKQDKFFWGEIEALRGVAVLATVLFHVDNGFFPLGYLGVDLFFIISGFVISKSIADHMSCLDDVRMFFVRRINRIFPALFFWSGLALLGGSLLMNSSDFSTMWSDYFTSIFQVSNLWFAFNLNYFDLEAAFRPLLHTWSLGVEEQFYLFVPWIFLFLRKKIFAAFFSVFFLSIILYFYLIKFDFNLGFFLGPARFWEIITGVIAFLLLRKSKQEGIFRIDSFNTCLVARLYIVLSYVCLLMVMGGGFFDEISAVGLLGFVSWWGFNIFVIGVIGDVKVGEAIRPLRLIGKISFSIYLSHWVLITFWSFYFGQFEDRHGVEGVTLVVMSCLFGYLSFQLIEQRLRYSRGVGRSVFFCGFCLVVFLGTTLSVEWFKTRDVEVVVPSRSEMWKYECLERVGITGIDEVCVVGDRGAEISILVWGDSHSSHLAPQFASIGEEFGVRFIVMGGCRPLVDGKIVFQEHKNPKRATVGCVQSIGAVYDFIDANNSIKDVVLTGYWAAAPRNLWSKSFKGSREELMLIGLSSTITKLQDRGKSVFLLGDTVAPGKARSSCLQAQGSFLPLRFERICDFLILDEIERAVFMDELLKEFAAAEQVGFHSQIEHICSDARCPMKVQGTYIYRDADHLRRDLDPSVVTELSRRSGLRQWVSEIISY